MAPRTTPTQNGTSRSGQQARQSVLKQTINTGVFAHQKPKINNESSSAITGSIIASQLTVEDSFDLIDIAKVSNIKVSDFFVGTNKSLTNISGEAYKKITGLYQDTPAIILSSEFLPFTSDDQNPSLGNDTVDRGYALNAKEKASLITGNNALRILSNKEETKKFIEDRKNKLIEYSNVQFNRGSAFIGAIDQATNILSVKNFSHIPVQISVDKAPLENQGKDPGTSQLNLSDLNTIDAISISDQPVSFEKYLKDIGLNPNNSLSSTTLYQQFLLELKRSLSTHTPFLNNAIASTPSSLDPIKKSYHLRGLFKSTPSNPIKSVETVEYDNSLFKRVSLVKIIDFRTVAGTVDVEAGISATDINSRSLFSLIDGKLSDFVGPIEDLRNSNPSQNSLIKTSLDVFQNSLGVSLESKNSSLVKFFTNSYELQNVLSLDFKTLSSLLSKEILYSRSLSNSLVRNKLNILASQNGEENLSTNNNAVESNNKVWDIIIGNKFLKNTLDLSNAQIVQDTVNTPRDLLGLSRVRIKNFDGDLNQYNVLSFENNDLPLINDEDYKLTHGSLYYIDRSLEVTRNSSGDSFFNTAKLDILRNSLSNSKNALKLLKQVYSGDDSDDESDKSILELLQKNSGENDPIIKIFLRLQPLQDAYKKTFQISSDKVSFSYELRKNIFSSSESKFITAATIFKKAATESSKEAKIIEKLLFHIVCREIYKSITGNYYSYEPPSNNNSLLYFPDFDTGFNGSGYLTGGGTAEQCIDLILLRGIKFYLKNGALETSLKSVPLENRSPIYSSTFDFNFKLIIGVGSSGSGPEGGAGSPYQNYLRFLGTGLDGQPEGLFKIVIDLMLEIYQENIYRSQIDVNTSNVTYYGGYEQTHILWMYFKLICQAITTLTPDKIVGLYSFNIAGETVTEEGYIIVPDKNNPPSSLYTLSSDAIKNNDVSLAYPSKANTRIKWYKQEKIRIANYIDILDQFVSSVNSKVQNFSSLLKGNFKSYLNETLDVFSKDSSLNEEIKKDLIRESFSREQIVLSEYVMSEIIDRFYETNNSEAILRTFPDFNSWQEKFINFAPLNDLSLISYSSFSSFFQDSKFFKEEGANKRILSIGIPPRLIRNLIGSPGGVSTTDKQNLKSNIVKISIYKNDVLRPGIIFEPKVFLFEMNRFPTRIATNWNNLKQLKETKDLLSIPTKFFNGTEFVLHRNRSEAYLDYPSGGFFPSADRTQTYMNHSWSYILEEYIRWFTRLNINETSYYQYGGVNSTNKMLGKQYENYISTTSNKFNLENVPLGENEIIVDNVDELINEYKNTVKSYLKNETLFLDFEEFRKRILYPKKFDRVFNVIFDPDEFEIYSFDSNQSLQFYKTSTTQKNVIKVIGENELQWIGKFGEKDTYIEEYWATIEPYTTE